MLYRRSTQVALGATLLLALAPEGTCRRVREIAEELGVPATYLAKVVQLLTRVGLLRAVRGPGGGVQLGRSAREIHLWDVLSATEPVLEFEGCFLRLRRCDDLHPCPLHEAWAPIRDQILTMLRTKNLWDVAAEAQRRGMLFWEPPADGGQPSWAPSSSGKQSGQRLERIPGEG